MVFLKFRFEIQFEKKAEIESFETDGTAAAAEKKS
jgi:hypothetical protein